MNYNNNTYCSR